MTESTGDKNQHRAMFSLPAEDKEELNRLIPWGWRSEIYRVITKQLIKALKSPDRRKIIALIINEHITLEDLLDDDRRSEEERNRTRSGRGAQPHTQRKKQAELPFPDEEEEEEEEG